MTLIKSISGIRGTIGGKVNENLTPLDAVKFASAYGTWLKTRNKDKENLSIVLGRDARISGKMISSLVANTLIGLGIDVIDLGLSTTPTVEVAVTLENSDGGIIITASHNPKQWNALKLLNEKGEFLDALEGAKILQLTESDAYIFSEVDDLGTYIKKKNFMDKHIDEVLKLELVDVEAIKNAKFNIFKIIIMVILLPLRWNPTNFRSGASFRKWPTVYVSGICNLISVQDQEKEQPAMLYPGGGNGILMMMAQQI